MAHAYSSRALDVGGSSRAQRPVFLPPSDPSSVRRCVTHFLNSPPESLSPSLPSSLTHSQVPSVLRFRSRRRTNLSRGARHDARVPVPRKPPPPTARRRRSRQQQHQQRRRRWHLQLEAKNLSGVFVTAAAACPAAPAQAGAAGTGGITWMESAGRSGRGAAAAVTELVVSLKLRKRRRRTYDAVTPQGHGREGGRMRPERARGFTAVEKCIIHHT